MTEKIKSLKAKNIKGINREKNHRKKPERKIKNTEEKMKIKKTLNEK